MACIVQERHWLPEKYKIWTNNQATVPMLGRRQKTMVWQLKSSLHPPCVVFCLAGEELPSLSYAALVAAASAVSAVPLASAFVLVAAALAFPFAACAVLLASAFAA